VHSYRVTAWSTGGTSAPAEVAITTGLRSPQDLTWTSPSGSGVALTWVDASALEASYRVDRDSGAGWAQCAWLAAGTTTWTDTGRSPGTRYSYRVRTVASGFADAGATTTATTIPAMPAGVAAAEVAGGVTVTWGESNPDESGFRVERSATGGSFALVAELPANTVAWTDGTVVEGTSYAYRVTAWSPGGTSAGNQAWASTSLLAPQGLAWTSPSSTSVALTWLDVSGREGSYRVDRQDVVGGAWTEVVSLGANSTAWTDTACAPGTSYGYRVRATGTGMKAGTSGEISATTIPSAPTAVTAVWSAASVRVDWTHADPAESGFHIESSTNGGPFLPVADLPADTLTWTDTSAQHQTPYTYRVTAVSAGGSSAPGDASITTP
jgi:titin